MSLQNSKIINQEEEQIIGEIKDGLTTYIQTEQTNLRSNSWSKQVGYTNTQQSNFNSTLYNNLAFNEIHYNN
jgi:hypothetical protein